MTCTFISLVLLALIATFVLEILPMEKLALIPLISSNALLDLAEAATDELMAKQREVLGTTADKVGKVYPTAPEV